MEDVAGVFPGKGAGKGNIGFFLRGTWSLRHWRDLCIRLLHLEELWGRVWFLFRGRTLPQMAMLEQVYLCLKV